MKRFILALFLGLALSMQGCAYSSSPYGYRTYPTYGGYDATYGYARPAPYYGGRYGYYAKPYYAPRRGGYGWSRHDRHHGWGGHGWQGGWGGGRRH